MSEASSRVSPIVAIAAVSVIIFSAVGVGVMTGVIPSSLSKTDDQAAKPEAPQATAPAPAPASAEKPMVATSTPRKQQSANRAHEPARVATAEPADGAGVHELRQRDFRDPSQARG